MANRLADETSPYLLQHKDNPVDWYPWGEEALARARERTGRSSLSIGYSACHWCHVMERESFEDPEIAALHERAVRPIKVDREERPDLDSIYMEACQAMTGQGGWPLNVFLTPEQVPFFAGTYFPPDSRMGMPSWRSVLEAVARRGTSAARRSRQAASRIAERLQRRRAARAVREPTSTRRRSTPPSETLRAQLRPARTAASAARRSSRPRRRSSSCCAAARPR